MAKKLTKEMWDAAELLFGAGFEWFAVDSDGSQRFFDSDPFIQEVYIGWEPRMGWDIYKGGDAMRVNITGYECDDWRTSKQRRPEAVTPENFRHCSNCIFLTVECTGLVNREGFCNDWHGAGLRIGKLDARA